MSRPNLMILTALLLTGSSIAYAYNKDHGPFPPEAKIEQIKLTELKAEPQDESKGKAVDQWRFLLPGDNGTQLLVSHEAGLFLAELTKGQTVLLKKTAFSDFDVFVGPTVYTGDLNQDGVTDFVIYSYSGGCGLASGCCSVCFVLSAGKDYRVTSVTTFWPDESNFVILNGKPCFVLTAFERLEKCRQGKSHTFWVYNLLGFKGDGMKVDNGIHPDFPKIIWYTDKPNHAETTIITDDQKKLLRESSLKNLFWTATSTPR